MSFYTETKTIWEKSIADKTNLESDSNLTNKFSLLTQTVIKKKSMRTVTVLV